MVSPPEHSDHEQSSGRDPLLESLDPLQRVISPQVFIGQVRELSIRGRRWTVHERETPDGRRSLIFLTEGVARRVVNYPDRWHELPDSELSLLSESY